MSSDPRVYHVEGDGWYIETPIIPEGPFTTEQEAIEYRALLGAVSAAGTACGWPPQRDETKITEPD